MNPQLRNDVSTIVRAAVDAVDPKRLVLRALAGDRHDGRPVVALCAGKAAAAMASGALHALGPRIRRGLIIGPQRAAGLAPFEAVDAGHPIPSAGSERAGRLALALSSSVLETERFLCFLSGGSSALMAVPAEGVSLADKQETTRHLLSAGADIAALNTVRKHLSAIKGGALGSASPVGCYTLAISDVVGDDLALIGSGPTVADPSRFIDALDVMQRFGALRDYPPAVVARVQAGARGDLPETLKPDSPRAAFMTAAVIGGRAEAMDGASEAARRCGYRVVRIDAAIVGEARAAALQHFQEIRQRVRPGDRVCVVSSGETTVHVTGSGRGGRNMEFALSLVRQLAEFGPGAMLASVGTDGIDGPTDAAGAIVDGTTDDRCRHAGIDPDCFSRNNDSYRFFELLGDLITLGPTGTNVGDLQVFLTTGEHPAPTSRPSI